MCHKKTGGARTTSSICSKSANATTTYDIVERHLQNKGMDFSINGIINSAQSHWVLKKPAHIQRM
jgi:hypothetical protein